MQLHRLRMTVLIWNHCAFSAVGRFVSRMTGSKLMGPKGVCAGQGKVAVVDNKGCGVVVYGCEGRQTGKFGTRGSDDSQLSGPEYCAFIPSDVTDQSPRIAVSDFHHNTVKVYFVNRRLFSRADIIQTLRSYSMTSIPLQYRVKFDLIFYEIFHGLVNVRLDDFFSAWRIPLLVATITNQRNSSTPLMDSNFNFSNRVQCILLRNSN